MAARKETEFLEEVGRRLAAIREKRNLPQDIVEGATKLNLDRIENAKSNYNFSSLIILCRYYKIKVSELLKGL